MHHNGPVRLRVAGIRILFLPVFLTSLLLVVAALFSPYPMSLTPWAILFSGAMCISYILKTSKANNFKLTLVIFTDGKVRLESNGKEIVAGSLVGQQWCTRWFAILRVSTGNTVRNMIILSSQQQEADDFRRLTVWLRQDLFNSTRAGRVLGS